MATNVSGWASFPKNGGGEAAANPLLSAVLALSRPTILCDLPAVLIGANADRRKFQSAISCTESVTQPTTAAHRTRHPRSPQPSKSASQEVAKGTSRPQDTSQRDGAHGP